MSMIEIIGIIASIMIVTSALSKTTTYSGTIWLRVMNMLGSILFIVYSVLLGAWSIMICNICMFVISTIYLFIEVKDHKKKIKTSQDLGDPVEVH